MTFISSVLTALDALHWLGFKPLVQIGIYRLGFIIPVWRWQTPVHKPHSGEGLSLNLQVLPDLEVPILQKILSQERDEILREAEEIENGMVRLFGGNPVSLDLTPAHAQQHWSSVHENDPTWEDIKFVWEPARLGWVFRLGRAYLLTQDARYARTAWKWIETFLDANPPNCGPNWISGQEVALRILAFSYLLWVFHDSPESTHQRCQKVAGAIYDHAKRLPPTIIYAQSQNNNHLLVESIGLYTAGTILQGCPSSSHWLKTGWNYFQRAVLEQFAPDGTYIQQSSNYHRLALQISLWGWSLSQKHHDRLSDECITHLAAASYWLFDQLDLTSGRVPNLGHHDGAYILPLAGGNIQDMRPIVQAAGRAFIGRSLLPLGEWDEMSLWFGLMCESTHLKDDFSRNPAVPRLGDEETWASLRAVHFDGRPAHADQLHVDLWWQGINLACDPGTYRYNAPFPWQNSLARTCVHNTIEIDGQDQMHRNGRFLWTKWAQAEYQYTSARTIRASHQGYQRLGVFHTRTIERILPTQWRIVDTLDGETVSPLRPHTAILHWLVPDWPWHIEDEVLNLLTPGGKYIQMSVRRDNIPAGDIQIIRAGEVLLGNSIDEPIFGWCSPTYNQKIPALSIRYKILFNAPTQFTSDWFLPSAEN